MSFERPHIARMQGYRPGEQGGGASVIKLNTNENPYPASPAVTSALRSVNSADLRRYPSPLADDFRRTAAALHGIQPSNIIPVNGGDELLRLVFTTFVDSTDSVLLTRPGYSLYPVLGAMQDCKLVSAPLLKDWSIPRDFPQRLRDSGARLCILPNPHAPVGSLLSVDYLQRLAEGFDGILLIDEAYVDFVEPALGHDATALATSRDNVLLLRTLSKGYSLAGLRFGYGIGAASLLEPMLYKTRDSYNTGYLAQKLAIAALESIDHARGNWARIRQSRDALSAALGALGLSVLPSQANFVLCEVPAAIGAERLYRELKQRNVLVRYFDEERLRDTLRISVGSEEENAVLLKTIGAIIQG